MTSNHPGSSVRNAWGAAIAALKLITAEAFFKQGAAIGIQVKQAGSKKWDNSATTIFYYVSIFIHSAYLINASHKEVHKEVQPAQSQYTPDTSNSSTVHSDPATQIYRLHAQHQRRRNFDPFYADQNPNLQHDDPETIPPISAGGRSYILLDAQPVVLPRSPLKGRYFCSVRVEGAGDNMELVVEVKQVGPHFRSAEKYYNSAWHRLPLYFDGGSRCVSVGERGVDLDDIIVALPSQPQPSHHDSVAQFLTHIASGP